MTSCRFLDRGGVLLAYLDFGGHGSPVVLLHGLAGHAGEWSETAGWLVDNHRVVAIDARGHGRSEREPDDVSRTAHVQDVAFVIEELGLDPVVLVGQSPGGITALLLAAKRPDLVRGLVLVEAGPEAGNETEVAEVAQSPASWPVPFPTREAAVEYFDGPSLSADTWVAGLEEREGGWWPAFDLEVMARTLRQAVLRSYWDRWDEITCPTLVVSAGRGTLHREEVGRMSDRMPKAETDTITDARHDLHLDQPGEWRRVLTGFLSTLP